MRWTSITAAKTSLHTSSRPAAVRFKGSQYPEFMSHAMYSGCCDAYVTLRDDFPADGQWVICSSCRSIIAFVPQQDLEHMRKGYSPDDLLGPVMEIVSEAMANFVAAAKKSAKQLPRLMRVFDEEPAKVFIDDGDGVFKELGNINRITLNYKTDAYRDYWPVDPIQGFNTGEPRGILDAIQETPQDDES